MTDTTTPPIGASATDWARQNGEHFTWSAAADRYEPTRYYLCGEGWHYDQRTGGGRAIVLQPHNDDRLDSDAFYLYDDGRVVRAYYVAGWHPEESHLVLHEMPTNYDENGDRKMRPDGTPVDHALGGGMGRRMAFHLTATTDDKRLETLEETARLAALHLEQYRQRHPDVDLTIAQREADSHHKRWQDFRDEVFTRRQLSGRWPGLRANGTCEQSHHHHAGDCCLFCGNDER